MEYAAVRRYALFLCLCSARAGVPLWRSSPSLVLSSRPLPLPMRASICHCIDYVYV